MAQASAPSEPKESGSAPVVLTPAPSATGAAPSSSSTSPGVMNEQQPEEPKPKPPLQDIDHNVVASLERSAEQLEKQLLEIQAALQASEQVNSRSTKNLKKKSSTRGGAQGTGRTGTELGFATVQGATLAPSAGISASSGGVKKRRGPKRKAAAKKSTSGGGGGGVIDVDDVAIDLEIEDGERDLVHRGGKSALGFRPLS